ncbi:MAG TPA: NAD-dependent epimerase/dehydratase family protein [Stellaceae bacterium]|nr:NAD-dependent epimerase/dehydratase family protein [Stellaceae bacterium]
MSRILITGASGFVGSALLPVLAQRHHLILAQRRAAAAPPAGAEIRVVGDIGPETVWSAALRDVDQVVHLAAHVHVGDAKADPATFTRVNSAGTQRLAEAASRAGIARFVFLSSVKVNGDASNDRPFRESDPPHPQDAYARSKWAAEQALAALAATGAPNALPIRPMEIVILRPPLVYGPGAKANFRALVQLCLLGVPLPFGAVDNQRSLIYSGNLADAIGCVLAAPSRPGCRTYLLRDGRDLSTGDLVRGLAAGINREARLPALPPDWLRSALRLIGKGAAADRLLGSLAVDDSRFRADYAWRPPYTVDEALTITARWFRDAAER